MSFSTPIGLRAVSLNSLARFLSYGANVGSFFVLYPIHGISCFFSWYVYALLRTAVPAGQVPLPGSGLEVFYLTLCIDSSTIASLRSSPLLWHSTEPCHLAWTYFYHYTACRFLISVASGFIEYVELRHIYHPSRCDLLIMVILSSFSTRSSITELPINDMWGSFLFEINYVMASCTISFPFSEGFKHGGWLSSEPPL